MPVAACWFIVDYYFFGHVSYFYWMSNWIFKVNVVLVYLKALLLYFSERAVRLILLCNWVQRCVLQFGVFFVRKRIWVDRLRTWFGCSLGCKAWYHSEFDLGGTCRDVENSHRESRTRILCFLRFSFTGFGSCLSSAEIGERKSSHHFFSTIFEV